MIVCRESGDNLYLCSYLVPIQWGKIFTGFVGICRISCFHFPHPAECFQATICARLKHIQLSDWTLRHIPRQISKDTKIIQMKWDFLSSMLQKWCNLLKQLTRLSMGCLHCSTVLGSDYKHGAHIEPSQIQDAPKLLSISNRLGWKTHDCVFSWGTDAVLSKKLL